MGVELESGQVERLLELDRKFGKEGLTFDDVLLVPAESCVLPNDVSTATRLTREIAVEIPIVSAAMDTVTEARLAIALAREGGIGILHRNLSIEAQVAEVDKVKRSESGMIVEPVTLPRDARVSDALELMATYHISGVPITDESGTLVGILTNRDLRFAPDAAQPVSELMTAHDLVTAPAGTTLAEAEAILHRHKIEKLPVVDAEGRLRGLITVKDIQKRVDYPNATKDERGRLRVGAAVGVGTDAFERAEALAEAGADVLVVDTAHGHHDNVTVMVGSALAGVEESPGEVMLRQGQRFKEYRGMGSLGAMKARSFSKDRYFQGDVEDVEKLVPEGIEGRVPYKGPLRGILYQLVGGLRQAMGYCGAATIEEMKDARFVRITAAGLRESHPHDIMITKESPNYRPG